MHPLLRTLDLTTGPGLTSSVHDLHPIRDAAAPRARKGPFLLSLGLTPLLMYGFANSFGSGTARLATPLALSPARNSVILLLESVPANVQAPARNLLGPAGPGGEGHREGTNTLDPRLAAYTSVLSRPSDAVDPELLSTSARVDTALLSLNPALPSQAGGNGLAGGTGRDAAQGAGGLIRPAVPVKVPDRQLIPTHQVMVSHQLTRGEEAALREPVRVRVLIGDDGVPFQVVILSGPGFLHEEALKAAREWRFEPLQAHGLKAPVSLTLIFYPTLHLR
jgi:TonB family protein